MRVNHNINRKRAAAANDETPPPKRHHPDAVEQLLATMKFQQQQIEIATDIWVRFKGGENRLGDASAMFLGLIKSAMYSGNLAVKMVETQDVDDDDDDDDELDERLDERFHEIEESLANKQTKNFSLLKQDMEDELCDIATGAADDLLFDERFAEAINKAVAQDPDVACDEELVEMKKFVRGQMKMAKEAPETTQDILREHEVEIGL